MHSGQAAGTHRSLPRWYEWLAVVVLALIAVAYLLIKPTAELAGRGVGSILSVAAAGAAFVAQQAHESACDAIRRDPEVAMLFGDAIECAPLEEATWYETHGRPELDFAFAIEGVQGMQGVARAVVTVDDSGTHLIRLVVTGPDQTFLVSTSP